MQIVKKNTKTNQYMAVDVKPIKPSDVVDSKIPDQIIHIVNEMISEKWDGISAVVHLQDIDVKISNLFNITITEVYKKRYISNIEDTFRKVGWKIINNTFPNNFSPHFIFKKE